MTDEYREQQSDFTEDHYRELVRLAKQRYRFCTDWTANGSEPAVLWRHDIDVSPHRARALARIEREEGVEATYFVLLHAEMYNALEAEVAQIVCEIAAMGHRIGLHFDPGFYARRGGAIETFLAFEKQVLETTLELPVEVFSWHNPSVGGWIESMSADRIAGMANAYGQSIRDRFAYVSDSHGIWRFRRLRDVLASGDDAHLHVLTHPEWWVPDAMPPRARIARAIAGRAARNERFYDEGIAAMGRPNVR